MPDHVGYAKVKITLINENDNRPIFSQPLYNISLYENVTVGTSVLTVLVSPHSPAGPLSSGANHGEAARGVLPKEFGQSGKEVPPSSQRLGCCYIQASGFSSLSSLGPAHCATGTSMREDEIGPSMLWFSAVSMKGQHLNGPGAWSHSVMGAGASHLRGGWPSPSEIGARERMGYLRALGIPAALGLDFDKGPFPVSIRIKLLVSRDRNLCFKQINKQKRWAHVAQQYK